MKKIALFSLLCLFVSVYTYNPIHLISVSNGDWKTALLLNFILDIGSLIGLSIGVTMIFYSDRKKWKKSIFQLIMLLAIFCIYSSIRVYSYTGIFKDLMYGPQTISGSCNIVKYTTSTRSFGQYLVYYLDVQNPYQRATLDIPASSVSDFALDTLLFTQNPPDYKVICKNKYIEVTYLRSTNIPSQWKFIPSDVYEKQ